MYKERQSLGRQPLVRLPMMIVVAVCLVASACGSRSGITEVEGQDEVVLAGGTLDYYGWEGYDRFFGAADPVIDDLGITFRSIYIGSAPEIAARFATGGGRGIDLLAWTSTNHHQLRNTPGVLSPISEDEVPNLAGLISQFGDDQWNHFKDDDGNWLAIPFSFAPLGITYDVTQVRPSAYADLLVPELKGRIGVPDGPGMHALVASAALGYEAQTLSPAQLEGVVSFMRRVWGQARLVSPSYGDIVALLDAGEIAAAYGGYPGLAAFTTNQNIRTVFPAEG